jgi:hypothetical protein
VRQRTVDAREHLALDAIEDPRRRERLQPGAVGGVQRAKLARDGGEDAR